MNRLVFQSRVGADGVLHVSVPVGKVDADREVRVTIEPVEPITSSPEDYVAWLHKRTPVYAYRFEGDWYDIGDRNQLLEADNRMRRRHGLPERAEYSPS